MSIEGALQRAETRARVPARTLLAGVQEGRQQLAQLKQFQLQAQTLAYNERLDLNDQVRQASLDKMAKEKNEQALRSSEQLMRHRQEDQDFQRQDRQQGQNDQVIFDDILGVESSPSFSDDGNFGDFQATRYGYKGDPYYDSNSAKGIGNRSNQLTQGSSIAMKKSSAKNLGIDVKAGDRVDVIFPDGKTGVYNVDDTIPETSGNNDRIDFFDPDGNFIDVDGSNLRVRKHVGQDSNALPASPVNSPGTALFPGGESDSGRAIPSTQSPLEGVRLSSASEPATQQPIAEARPVSPDTNLPTASPTPQTVTIDDMLEEKAAIEGKLSQIEPLLKSGNVRDRTGVIPRMQSRIQELQGKIANEPLITDKIIDDYADATKAARSKMKVKVMREAAKRGWTATRTTAALSSLDDAVEDVKEERGLSVSDELSIIKAYTKALSEDDSEGASILRRKYPDIITEETVGKEFKGTQIGTGEFFGGPEQQEGLGVETSAQEADAAPANLAQPPLTAVDSVINTSVGPVNPEIQPNQETPIAPQAGGGVRKKIAPPIIPSTAQSGVVSKIDKRDQGNIERLIEAQASRVKKEASNPVLKIWGKEKVKGRLEEFRPNEGANPHSPALISANAINRQAERSAERWFKARGMKKASEPEKYEKLKNAIKADLENGINRAIDQEINAIEQGERLKRLKKGKEKSDIRDSVGDIDFDSL